MTGWRKRQVLDMAEKASQSKQDWWKDDDALEAFAKLVREDEREACAIVCDDINAKYKWPDDVAERVASQWCADSIRARGDQA
jgi:hypothetical protein